MDYNNENRPKQDDSFEKGFTPTIPAPQNPNPQQIPTNNPAPPSPVPQNPDPPKK